MLMGSILAHEATHAWLAFHPKRRIGKKLPKQVEEGVCQLVAYFFLKECRSLNPTNSSKTASKRGEGGPSDEKLLQYFRWAIENHNHPDYGQGFQNAERSYAQLKEESSLDGYLLFHLLDHVATNETLPFAG